MPATLGSSLASAMALRLRASARAAEGSSFLLVPFSGLGFLPMRPWREGVVVRGRTVAAAAVRRVEGRAGAVGRRVQVGSEPRRLRMLKMVDMLDWIGLWSRPDRREEVACVALLRGARFETLGVSNNETCLNQKRPRSRSNQSRGKPHRCPEVSDQKVYGAAVDGHGMTIVQLKELESVGRSSRVKSGQALQKSDDSAQ